MLVPFANLHIAGSAERQMILADTDCDDHAEQAVFVQWVVDHRASLRVMCLSLEQKHLYVRLTVKTLYFTHCLAI